VRYFYWRSALDAFRAHPLLGTGAGTFEFWWDRHATTGDFIRNAHSIELETMAELGLPGLGLIVAVVIASIAALVRARRQVRRAVTVAAGTGLFAAFLVFLLQASVDWMWQSTAVTALALGGVAIGSMRLRTSRPRVRVPTRALVVAFAVLAVLVQVPGLLSTLATRRSQRAERARDASAALSWADLAVNAEPWAASPYEQRGLVLEAAGRLPAARADLERAVAREPDNFTHRLVLARIETEAGDRKDAARQLARARLLRPHALVFAQPTG
jgi:hypothetical protein